MCERRIFAQNVRNMEEKRRERAEKLAGAPVSGGAAGAAAHKGGGSPKKSAAVSGGLSNVVTQVSFRRLRRPQPGILFCSTLETSWGYGSRDFFL